MLKTQLVAICTHIGSAELVGVWPPGPSIGPLLLALCRKGGCVGAGRGSKFISPVQPLLCYNHDVLMRLPRPRCAGASSGACVRRVRVRVLACADAHMHTTINTGAHITLAHTDIGSTVTTHTTSGASATLRHKTRYHTAHNTYTPTCRPRGSVVACHSCACVKTNVLFEKLTGEFVQVNLTKIGISKTRA